MAQLVISAGASIKHVPTKMASVRTNLRSDAEVQVAKAFKAMLLERFAPVWQDHIEISIPKINVGIFKVKLTVCFWVDVVE